MRKLCSILVLLTLAVSQAFASDVKIDGIIDNQNKPIWSFLPGTAAVNFCTLTTGNTGVNPIIAAESTADANVSLALRGKGTGGVTLQDSSGNSLLTTVKVASAVDNLQVTNAATGNGIATLTNAARATTTVTLTTAAAHGYIVGQYVQVIAVTNDGHTTQAANINGIWQIATVPTTTTFTYTDSISGTIASAAETGTVIPMNSYGPLVTAVGTDSNIGNNIISKGTGTLKATLGGSNTVAPLVAVACSQWNVSGVLCTASSTDDTLFAYTLPANSLKNVGDYVRVTNHGLGSASAGTFKSWFGGTAFVSDGGVTSATPVRQQFTVVKTGASTQIVFTDDNYHGTTANIARAAPTTAAITDTADIQILFTANSGAATEKGFGMIVEFGHQ